MGRVDGRVALVTGASSGLGHASAVKLAGEGAQVVLADINEARLREVVADIQASGGTAMMAVLDVGSEPAWEAAYRGALDRFGRMDILVNCAGVVSFNTIENETYEQWAWHHRINLDGVFFGMKHGFKAIRESDGGGSIINFSSVMGIRGHEGIPSYCSSKGGVRAITKSAALHGGPLGIRVNSVHPAHIRTPMTINMVEASDDPEANWKDMTAQYPIGRIGEPEDVANAVLFLASDEASFISGLEMVVDGGYSAGGHVLQADRHYGVDS